MLRSSSQPLIRAIPEPLKFDGGSPNHGPLAQARCRRPLPLDGGKSPFARSDVPRLPALLLSRSTHLEEEKSPQDLSPAPRRVGFASNGGTPFGTPSALRESKSRKDKKGDGSRSKSQFGREKTVLFLEEDGSLPRARRSTRRQKTWTCTTTPATEASTPSYVSHSPKSSTSIPASPESTVSGTGSQFAWTKGAPIGTGSYGCVYKALDTMSGRIFAVKQAIVDDRNEQDRKYLERLEAELTICKDLRHPNIVETLGFQCNDSNHLYIYLEYVPGGSMSSLLQEFGALTGDLLIRSTNGVLQGLNYLHLQKPPVVHRDIKGANILVDVNFTVKLSDFGCSKRDNVTTSFTTIGSIPWMAPEVIQQQDGYGRKADIWSLGCVFIEMATAEKPWGNGAFENVMFALRHIAMSEELPPIPASLSEAGQDFASSCLQRDPHARPYAVDLLSHRFVCESSLLSASA